MMNERTEAKAQRLMHQAMALYGMTKRAAREWTFTQLVADAETAAHNATRMQTYYSETLQTSVSIPEA